jgi:hypothetical protein
VAAAVEKAMMPRAEARHQSIAAFRQALERGWVAGERLEQAAQTRPTGGLAPDTGLLGAIRRVLGGSPSAPGATPSAALQPLGPAAHFTLAERLVEWRSRADKRGAIEVILALERAGDAPPQLRLTLSISQRGQRGKLAFQQIMLAEGDARAFAGRLAELLRLGSRLTVDTYFEVGRSALRGEWPGSRGPLTLRIRTIGPRGGVKTCAFALERRQVEALSYELQQGLRRVRPT